MKDEATDEREFRSAVCRVLDVLDPEQVKLAVKRAHADAGEPQEAQDMLQLARTFASVGIRRQWEIVEEEAVEWRRRKAAEEVDLGDEAKPDLEQGTDPAPEPSAEQV